MFGPAGFLSAEVQFDKDAHLVGSDDDIMALAKLAEITDLVIMVHGWNNNIDEARALYEGLASFLRTVVNDNAVPALTGRTIGLAGLSWPSKKFTDRALIPGGAAAFGSAIDQHDVQQQIAGLADQAVLEKAKSLVPLLEDKATARSEFAAALRSLLDKASAEPDDATTDFFTLEPSTLMNSLAVPAMVIGPSSADGGATDIDVTPEFGGVMGRAAGLGSTPGGVLGAAESLLNFITYYQMKARAGTVGENGLAPLVERIRQERADLRIHLVGHSFGGRLVTAGANQLPHHTVASLTLLQAAFSHYGFSNAWSPGQPGHFRNTILNQAVSGPTLITHTSNDLAVGIAYAIASRIAGQTAAALGDANDTYGGIGRNGAQKTPEAIFVRLLDVAGNYTWTPHALHNLLADAFIKDHSDIKNPQVAYALLSAIGST
jgi:pimeloyl-ACP methyl ester carboxylesterase